MIQIIYYKSHPLLRSITLVKCGREDMASCRAEKVKWRPPTRIPCWAGGYTSLPGYDPSFPEMKFWMILVMLLT